MQSDWFLSLKTVRTNSQLNTLVFISAQIKSVHNRNLIETHHLDNGIQIDPIDAIFKSQAR